MTGYGSGPRGEGRGSQGGDQAGVLVEQVHARERRQEPPFARDRLVCGSGCGLTAREVKCRRIAI